MIAQRPSGSAPVVRALAEALPFGDGSFDASMAVLSDHHWGDRARGLREMRRVARMRAVLFTWDRPRVDEGWPVRDFLPGFRRLPGMPLPEIADHLGATEIQTVAIPADCRDGFLHAYWARPHAYLDPAVRRNISVFARLPAAEVDAAGARLPAAPGSPAPRRGHAANVGEAQQEPSYPLLIADTHHH